MSRPVCDGVVGVCEEILPTELLAVQNTGSGEVLEVFVVGYDFDRDLGSFQQVSPVLECFYNGKGLLIRDPVVLLSRVHGPQVEGNGVVLQVCGPFLAEDGPVGIVGGISFHLVSDVRVWVGKYWGGGYYVFECLECHFFFGCPCPRAVVFCEVMEGPGDVCKSLDEVAVKVAKPNEFTYSLDFGGRLPFTNGTTLVFVHPESITR